MNALLLPFDTPYDTVPFDQIKPNQFEPAFKQKIKEAQQLFDKIIEDKSIPTFKNTFIEFEQKYDELSRLSLILFNLNSAETNSELQAVTQSVSPILTKFTNQIQVNEKYFQKVEYLYDKLLELDLSKEEQQLVKVTYQNMKRNGANLSPAKKTALLRIQMNLSKLTLKFNENVLEETQNFHLHITEEEDIDGLPEHEKQAAKELANSKGVEGWMIGLDHPSYVPFMKFAKNRLLREKLYKAFTSRGNNNNKNDNKKLTKRIVHLRLKLAKLLGYTNYSAYVLDERMAGKPANVHQFLWELHQASKEHATKEIEELKMFARKKGLTDELAPWDFYYYSEMLKDEKFGFRENELKPYFELHTVVEGIFDLARKLYDISFHEVHHIPVYYKGVQTYEVHDYNHDFLGILYTDFHPRKGKQGGAWMTEYRSQSNINGETKRPHISICCNFTPPTENNPSLLTFDEVNTFLHEFGHALHGLFANTTYPSLSGTNVYRDFVELPSQLMENWLNETAWVKQFAKHNTSGKTIPDQLLEKVVKAKNFQSGYQSERQLSFGLLDMAWHSIESPLSESIESFERSKLKDTQIFQPIEGSSISTAFSHIFAGGYAAGYYGYKWAEVLDADAFELFKENGIFDKATAHRFRKEILEKGGTQHPEELYINFRGRKAKSKALLKRSGLA